MSSFGSNKGDDQLECPLCMEPLEMDDVNFFPCTCGYQICRFCWHRIRTDENGLCPACRKQYPEDPAEFKPLSQEELQRIKNERKQKDLARKQKISESRKHLANVRVVQKNLVFVVGLSPRLADPEVLKKHEYFGKFGKIHKVVINNNTSYAGAQGPSASAYVTFVRSEDALRAIQTVNNAHVDGRTLKASLGTTKYCSHFLKGAQCQKPDCMYLHELGDEAASFTKEDMQMGKHQEYEQKLLEDLYRSQKISPSPPTVQPTKGGPTKDPWPTLQQTNKPNDRVIGSSANGIGGGQQATNQKPPDILRLQSDGQSNDPFHSNSKEILPPSSSSPLTPPKLGSPTQNSTHFKNPFEIGDLSQSLFSHNDFRRIPTVPPQPTQAVVPPHIPPIEPPADQQGLGLSNDSLPVESTDTDWQAAFGFGTSSKQEDDLGFDPWDESAKALADLMEKELKTEAGGGRDEFPRGRDPQHHSMPNHFQQHYNNPSQLPPATSQLPPRYQANQAPPFNSMAGSRMPFMGNFAPDASAQNNAPWMQYPQPGLPGFNPGFFDNFGNVNGPTLVRPPGFGLSRDNASMNSDIDMKDWQEGLRSLLPNINIHFGPPMPPPHEAPHGQHKPPRQDFSHRTDHQPSQQKFHRQALWTHTNSRRPHTHTILPTSA
ncbi:CCR4-NOT transcription complex subunit 4 [Branchiostoma belcheri]|nr:CCR4-NOT transcription complex subunit 4 [Branchiostoma belcheri]